MKIRESVLYSDLNAETRDVMYCAMTYITRSGGPALVGPPEDIANLRANRGPIIEWLLKQPDQNRIIKGYDEFKKRWNPIFPD